MSARPHRRRHQWVVYVALLPMAATVLFAYLGTVLWSVRISMSSSRTFPADDFVGLSQYIRLFNTERWLLSLHNVVLFGVLFIAACLILGFLLAVFIDQKVRAEDLLRTVFLYPFAMSFVATGLVWQWILNPQLGIQATVRRFGFEDFAFNWIVDQDKVMYTIVVAAVWQASGLVMALMLAGLRGIDEEIWKAARIDGGGFWRIFVQLMLPMSVPIIIVAVIVQVTGIWNDFILGLVFAGRENLPMTVQLNNVINTTTGERLYNVNMAATVLTSMVPLLIYFISGRWFVKGITAGAVKG